MTPPFVDPETGFSYPGPNHVPFYYTPTKDELERALGSMILSASGWRKVYAAGDEENTSPDLRAVDRALALGMADTFAGFLTETSRKGVLRVAVGIDARFTGPALADGMVRMLVARGIMVDYLGIVAAPQIMAWVQRAGLHDGFIYVSASHNPIGHNGVKFGLGNGGVVGGTQAAELIARFRAAVDPSKAEGWIDSARTASETTIAAVLTAMPAARKASSIAYAALSDEILTLTDDSGLQARRKVQLADLVRSRGLGIVGELNGSARGLSIDKPWLEALGVKTSVLNGRPRQIVHRIVPEGPSLDLCRRELEKAYSLDPAYSLGYVPDCDGDRGNVVFYDSKAGKARILEAQEVFALCVLSELAGLTYYGEAGTKVAVACNDPTSLRVDAIARAFGAAVFRAEVGEANVVSLARNLRTQGWTVRILGEGSNGGNITFPGSVRDPLSTLGSLLKLLCLRSAEGKPGLFELWCERSGQPSVYRPDYDLADLLATLPAWTTTPTSEDRAMLKIRTLDHGALKASFETRWQAEWDSRKIELRQKFGIAAWEEVNYEGAAEKPGFGPAFRSGRQTGGLKIVLKDGSGIPVACLWMRGSGTEPVFRILAEARGNDPEGEVWLLDWLTSMVKAADGALPPSPSVD
jgi:phosphomannomutase